MAIQTELLNILLNNSYKKQLSEKDYVFELSLEQYEKLINDIKLYYGLIKDAKIDTIINIVLLHFGLTRKRAEMKTRKREILIGRQVSAYFLKKYTKLTLAQIANEFHQDHATALSSIRVVNNLLDTNDGTIRDDIEVLESKLGYKK